MTILVLSFFGFGNTSVIKFHGKCFEGLYRGLNFDLFIKKLSTPINA